MREVSNGQRYLGIRRQVVRQVGGQLRGWRLGCRGVLEKGPDVMQPCPSLGADENVKRPKAQQSRSLGTSKALGNDSNEGFV